MLAFVHGKPDEITVGKAEGSAELRQKLDAFRARVMKEYPVREWTSPHELGALASRSLIQEIKRNPRPGWIRNDEGSPVALLQRIDALNVENLELRNAVQAGNKPPVGAEELASGPDRYLATGSIRRETRPETTSYSSKRYVWRASATWDDIFQLAGRTMLNEAQERTIRDSLSALFYESDHDNTKFNYGDPAIYDDTFADIMIQLRALGLVAVGTKKRPVNDKANYWKLTDYGDRYLVSLLAKRKPATLSEVDDLI